MTQEAGPLRISVALATFNGGDHLNPLLESLARQRRPPDEVVIIDDASSDDTLAICQSWADTVPFAAHVAANEWRLGSTSNFEGCLHRCTGDVIALCDQDDRWLPTKLEVIERAFITAPIPQSVFSDALLFGDSVPGALRLWSALGIPSRAHSYLMTTAGWSRLVHGSLVTGATMAVTRELRDLAIPFPPQVQAGGGWMIHDGWLALLAAAAHNGGLVALEEPLIEYRVHSGQQIGLRGVVASSRRGADRSTLRYEYERIDLVATRFQERGYADAALELRRRQEYLLERMTLAQTLFPRLLQVVRHFLQGRYHRYANGTRSALADVVLGIR